MNRFGINLRLTTPDEALEDSVVSDPGYKLKGQILGQILVGVSIFTSMGALVFHSYKLGSIITATYNEMIPFHSLWVMSMLVSALFFVLLLMDPSYGAGVPDPINIWPILLASILRTVANYWAGNLLIDSNYLWWPYHLSLELIINLVVFFTFMTEDGCDNFMHALKPWAYIECQRNDAI